MQIVEEEMGGEEERNKVTWKRELETKKRRMEGERKESERGG